MANFSFGSDELKRNFLAPAIAGDMVTCLGVSEVGAGSDVASKFSYCDPKRSRSAEQLTSSWSLISYWILLQKYVLETTIYFLSSP